MEYAFEGRRAGWHRGGASVFTTAVVEGLETGEADGNQDGQAGLDELHEYARDKVGAASDLVLLPGCAALPAWAWVRRGWPARAGTGRRARFTGVTTGAGNLWSRAAVRLCPITAPASSVVTSGPGISRSAWALIRAAIGRAGHRSAGLAQVGERAGPGRP